MSEYTEAEAQADADALVARLEAEPALRDALVADPRGTLLEAGVRTDIVDEIEKALAGVEVQGFAAPEPPTIPPINITTVVTFHRVIEIGTGHPRRLPPR